MEKSIGIVETLTGKNIYIINSDLSSVNESVWLEFSMRSIKVSLVGYQTIALPHKDSCRVIL